MWTSKTASQGLLAFRLRGKRVLLGIFMERMKFSGSKNCPGLSEELKMKPLPLILVFFFLVFIR